MFSWKLHVSDCHAINYKLDLGAFYLNLHHYRTDKKCMWPLKMNLFLICINFQTYHRGAIFHFTRKTSTWSLFKAQTCDWGKGFKLLQNVIMEKRYFRNLIHTGKELENNFLHRECSNKHIQSERKWIDFFFSSFFQRRMPSRKKQLHTKGKEALFWALKWNSQNWIFYTRKKSLGTRKLFIQDFGMVFMFK